MKKNYFSKIATLANPLVTSVAEKTWKNMTTAWLLALFTLLGFSDAFGQIAQRGTATSATSTTTTITINKPTGVVTGDVMLVNISSIGAGGSNLTAPTSTGWTLIQGAQITQTTRYGAVLYKIATSSEPASYTFTLNTDVTNTVGAIVAFSGVDNSTPLDVASPAFGSGINLTTVTATGLTSVTNNAAILMFAVSGSSGTTWTGWSTATPVTALTELFDAAQATSVSVGGAWAIRATAGATGNGTATLTSSRAGAILVALRPSIPPTITSLATTSGCPGSTLTINGTNLTGATSVTIGGTSATIVSNTPTSINVTVGSGTTGTVQVTTPNGIATSAGTYTIVAAPVITTQPIATSICTNATGSFTVTATGATTYQWRRNGTPLANGGIYSGVTTATLTITNPTLLDAGNFDVIVGNGSCTTTSSVAALTVNTVPSIAATPTPASGATGICYAGSGVLANITWGAVAGATSYDVYFGPGATPPVTLTANVATNSYAVGALAASTQYSWRIVARNACGAGTTSANFSFTTAAAPCSVTYCASNPTNNTYSYISNVQFNTINNASTGCASYTDFTAISTTVIKGNTHNLTIIKKNDCTGTTEYTGRFAAWIDWNQNGIFEAGEQVLTDAAASNGPLTAAVTIPVGALTGPTRMRCIFREGTIAPPACGAYSSWGETEDYTIVVVNPLPCVTPTAQPTAISLTPSGTSISGSFTAASPAADSYLVLVSTNPVAPTAPVNGTTYTIGSVYQAGYTVVDNDSNTDFNATGLSLTTTYYFYIYSFNGLCTGGPLYLGAGPLTGSTTTLNASYCIPTIGAAYATSTTHHIRKVEFIGTLQDIVNTSTFSSVAPIGFQNFTGLAVKSIQAKGEGVNIYMESPSSGYIKAWVDWNSNGSFEDAGERVYDAGGVSQASTTLGFIVPTGIPAGDYRVRLRISGRNTAGSDAGFSWNSCTPNLAYYGETEDYILRVIENCPARISTVTNGSVCGSGPVTLQATATAGTTEFRWYTTQTGGSYVPTATGIWNTPSISTTTVYWVTAFNGTCETLVRTKITAFVKPVPTLSFATSNTEVCGENSIVALTASGDNEIIYLLDEKFEGGMGTFSNVHYVSNAAVNAQTAWQIRTSPYVPTGLTWYPAIQSNFGANNFAFVNSDIGQPGSCPGPPGSQCYYTIDNGLVSTTVNTTGFLSLTFKFRMYFDRYFPTGSYLPDELMTVDVSRDGGTTWLPISGNIVTDIGYGTRFSDFSYDLSSHINQTNLKVRVRYYTSTWANGAAVDDIELYGLKPLTTALNWTGTPLPDVYTDAATTLPYTAGTPATTVYVKPNLAQLENGDYTFTATATLTNGCNVSQNITIFNKSTIWKGTVSNDWNNPSNWNPPVVPDANSCVIIPSLANSNNNKSEIIGPGFNGFGKTLIVKNDGVLEVNAVNTLTITDFVQVDPTGTFLIEDSSSLIQINNAVNTGNIRMQRNTNIRRLDYVYWSTPVANFASSAISPLTPTSFIYKWAPTTATAYASQFGNWVAGSENMTTGRGYIVRGPDNFTSTKQIYQATFVGVPNNGIITTPISRSTYTGANYTGPTSTQVTANDDNWNLIGNPYPSAVSADAFLATNSTKISGWVKIWTHGTLPLSTTADPFYQDYGLNYTVADYLTYNALGPTQPGFNGYIGAGQGFFVLMSDAAATPNTVEFNNTMRNRTYQNDQFFRDGNAGPDNEKHRIWLQLISPAGTESKSLVGYATGATNGIDHSYDAINVGVKTNFEIYSVAENQGFSIQGRTLPFNNNDQIQIGVTIPQNGNYTIAIASVDGLFTMGTQNIYLEDKLLGITHDLRLAPYSFTGTVGSNETRFVLKFNNETLGNEEFTSNAVTVYTNESINVNVTNQNIKSVRVHDLLGRVLGTFDNVNTNNFSTRNVAKTQSPLLVEVTLENGATKTYKVIF